MGAWNGGPGMGGLEWWAWYGGPGIVRTVPNPKYPAYHIEQNRTNLNRTNSEDIERLNSMLFGHRTKSENYFFCEFDFRTKSNEIEIKRSI